VAIKYKNPPINELIIGAYFEPPLAQLHSEHVGVFWSSVRKKFPTIRQQQELSVPIVSPSFQIGFTDEAYPMPRFWLIADDDVMLLQIQKNAFLLNWRKREKEYPHFDQVKAQFDEYLSEFRAFLKAELGIDNLPIQVVELTYTNLIAEGDVWTGPASLGSVLPGVRVPELDLPLAQKPDINYVTAYKFATDLVVNFTVRNARQITDASKTALIFEFRAIGVLELSNLKTADEWYSRAHDVIGKCFTALTSEDIRKSVWQPE
jgi:uncharacterized protein (TIGR04255 family)